MKINSLAKTLMIVGLTSTIGCYANADESMDAIDKEVKSLPIRLQQVFV